MKKTMKHTNWWDILKNDKMMKSDEQRDNKKRVWRIMNNYEQCLSIMKTDSNNDYGEADEQ